jgi:hypothetical protein
MQKLALQHIVDQANAQIALIDGKLGGIGGKSLPL